MVTVTHSRRLLAVLLGVGAAAAQAGELVVHSRTTLVPTLSGQVEDRSAAFQLSQQSEDRSYLRNGADGASFQYVLRGQVSADSAFGSGSDRAGLSGSLIFEFDL